MPDAASTPAVRLAGLRKAFPGPFGPLTSFVGAARREVLHGIDLELARGRMLGLVGPNGSGKTTLLRLLAGLERPSAGELVVLGGTPDSGEVRRRVGFLSEDSPFPPELRAGAALELLAALQGISRGERRGLAATWLERVGLAAEARRPLGRFSKGMLRRFGLAQALLHEPELVLLDEPTAGLDAVGVGLLGTLLDEVRARGGAVVLSSHLLSDVFDPADELAVLIDGSVRARGAPAELVSGLRRVRLELEDASPELLARIDELARASGAEVAHRGPGSNVLLELYRRFGAGG
ncbi:MAG: ABC transporter ATP-binding protein [Planctomycetota bacterium]